MEYQLVYKVPLKKWIEQSIKNNLYWQGTKKMT